MDKLKYILVSVILILHTQINFAQENRSLSESKSTVSLSSRETVFVHSNATTFVSGETLYYKLYCLNPTNNLYSSISKIAYIELIDNTKQKVFTNKIYLENGIGQGDFFVGTNLKTGVYKLIAYTNWMLNNTTPAIFETNITIVNPFEFQLEDKVSTKNNSVSESKIDSYKTPTTLTPNSVEPKILSLELDKKIFSNREKVNLNIESLTGNLEKGNYSISVRKTEGLPTNKQLSAIEFIKSLPSEAKTSSLSGKILYLPEFRGELITGSITSKKDSKDLNNKTVALSIPGKSFAFKIVKTNQSGNFTFILDKNPINSSIVLQLMDQDRNDYTIQLNKPIGFDTSTLKSSTVLNLTSNNSKTIEEQSVANQIQNAYYYTKKDSLETDSKFNPFFHPLEKEYVLDDFKRFPTFKETITEVVTELYFKQKDNTYSLHLRNNNFEKEELPEPSLVLVDGNLIQDINELLVYKTENIYKISIVPGAYYYGPKLFNGIISLTTKNNDYISKSTSDSVLKTDILRPLNKKMYYKQDYTDTAKYDRIPDYRYQLLWMPEFSPANKENRISFYASDVSGEFEIILEGFTEKGIPVSLRESIEVK